MLSRQRYVKNISKKSDIQSSPMSHQNQSEKIFARKFACTHDGCDEAFSDQRSLSQHLRMHYTEAANSCSKTTDLRKSDSLSSNLSQEKGSKEERRYVCEICQQSFTQVSNLNRHKQAHDGKKPFSCDQCDKKFSTSSNLKQHSLVHQSKEGRSKFTCEHCGTEYFYKASLNKHLKSHQNQAKTEPSLEELERNESDELVKKKQFTTPTSYNVPDAQLESLQTKENVQNLLSFWDENSRAWIDSKLKIEPLIMYPQASALQLQMHLEMYKNIAEGALSQFKTPEKDRHNVQLSTVSKKCENSANMVSSTNYSSIETEPTHDEHDNKAMLSSLHKLNKNPEENTMPAEPKRVFGQGIVIPKPIRPTTVNNNVLKNVTL